MARLPAGCLSDKLKFFNLNLKKNKLRIVITADNIFTMVNVKKTIMAFIFSCFCMMVFANKIILTAQNSIDYALENNISLKQEKINLEAKKRENKYSWNSVSPTASLSASYNSTKPSKENSKDTFSTSARISSTLTPSLWTQIQNAKLSYGAQEISYEVARNTISSSVLKNYYDILYQIQNLSLSKTNLETKKNQYQSNLEKFNRGLLNKVDVLSAKINYQDMELTVESKKIDLDSSIASFKQVLGIEQNQDVEFSGNFDSIYKFKKIDSWIIEKNCPSVSLLEKRIMVAKNNLLSSRFSAYGPSLSASYNYSKSYYVEDFSENNSGGTLTIGASIPLDGFFPWSNLKKNINTAFDTINNLELDLQNEKISIQIKTQFLVQKINQCVENIKLRKSSIELAETNYDMTLKAYNYGTKDLLTLQAAQDSLLSTKVNLVSDANELISSLCELENICGIVPGTLIGEIK